MYANSNFEFSQVVGPRGLLNLGNTCYVNAVLQGLQGFVKFREFFIKTTFTDDVKGRMAKPLSKLMTDLGINGVEPYDSSKFLEALKCSWGSFVQNQQMDAEEFFTFLIDVLHDELKTNVDDPPGFIDSQEDTDVAEVVANRWRSMPFRSPIAHLLHIQTVTFLYCPTCNYQHGQYADVTNHLSLPVECSIEESFKTFSMESYLEDGKCNACGSLGLKHRLLLGRLPPLLVVHLKRFQHNSNGTLTKINANVEVSGVLDLEPFAVQGIHSSHRYKLLGVTSHHGKSIDRGHYTTVISRGGRLYNFDDSRVANTTARKFSSTTSYLLWYELIESDGELLLDVERRLELESEIHQPSPASPPSSHDTTQADNDLEDTLHENDVETPLENSQDDDKLSLFSFEDDGKGNSSEDLFSDEDIDISKEIQSLHIAEHDLLQVNSTNVDECNSLQYSPPDCNHVNFDLDVMDPQLSEEEVPGAKISMDYLQNCLKSELERWLQCRRLIKSGTKTELIERIVNHQKKGKSMWIFPGIDGGKWYELKRKKLMEQADSPSQRLPMMPLGVSIFKPFPSAHIPNGYCIDKARKYLQKIPLTRFSYENGVQSVECEPDEECLLDFSQPSQDDRKNIFVSGTMQRANQFVDSGRVLSVTDCERGDHWFLKADVHASYRNHTYKISIMISKKSGSVCFAECCCKAKALGRCCHIMAVLILISRHVQKEGHEAVTCTGRTCYWLARGSSAHRQPDVVREQSQFYGKTNYHRRGHFDPRPTSRQVDSDEELVRNFHHKLSQEVPKCLWYFQLLQTPEILPEYPDQQLTKILSEQCSYLLWNLNNVKAFSTSSPQHLFRTQDQYLSQFWFCERAVRMPASQAKTILGLGTGMLKFMRKHIWGLEPFENDAMRRGRTLEPKAREHYMKELKKVAPLCAVMESGIWVNPLYPQLSCSPDGLVIDTNGICKLLEIKCPAVLEEMDPNDWENLPPPQLGRFCLYRCNNTGEVKLKQTDKWYYQVQMSMDIMKVNTCDFVIFSTVNDEPKSLTVPVPFDESFWKEKRERLIKIHREWFVPEYFMLNTVFHRKPQQLIYSPFHEDHDDTYFGDISTLKSTLSVQNESAFIINDQEDTSCESTSNVKIESQIVIYYDDEVLSD